MPNTLTNEAARLEALRSYNILDTPPEKDFDELVMLAAQICQTPVSLVSLVDADRQWFKGRYGLAISETPRCISFCQQTIQQPLQLLEIPDATQDTRFAESELVLRGPKFRYYAGFPLVNSEGHALGTLCVLDQKPRQLNPLQRESLRILSRQVMAQLELRRKLNQLQRVSSELVETHVKVHQHLQALVEERTRQLTAQREELLRKTRLLQLLNETGRVLLKGGNPDQMLDQIYQKIADQFHMSGILEFSLNEEDRVLHLEMVSGAERGACRPNMTLQLGEGIAGTVAQCGRPLVFTHVQTSADPRLDMVRSYGVRAYVCYPLIVGQRVLGTLSFASNLREEFAPEDRDFLETLASNVALAKDRYGLTRQLEDHARSLEQAVSQRTAKIAEMMAELRQMSYSMVHEMRAPLRSIGCFIDLLGQELEDSLEEPFKTYFSRIKTSVNRMDLLITGALNYSQILQESPALEPVAVGRLLCDMVTTTPEFQPPRAQISLKGEFPMVLGNEGLMARCFYHLLYNAVTYVPAGRPPVVDIASQSTKGKVRFCVSDNGAGIPESVLQRIFELFERGDADLTKGAGVGLALVRKSVERMQGRLWVESTPGCGSRFWLEFKAAQ